MKLILLLLTLLQALAAQFNPKAEEAKLRALLADYTPPLPYTKDAIRWSGATPAPVIPGQPRVAAYASAGIGARTNERDKEPSIGLNSPPLATLRMSGPAARARTISANRLSIGSANAPAC